ncbi:bi-domain-containing oxidoreductase [Dyadobacter aurulentus]|uniref:bi-domain-containing oxidoreductase n=1 Tax=Dyadobacter sp. UC 10 TaxID=2605428 RepID=UPI0011F31C46|nr:bi-domain-containing oxidoreductase [Dyadobacter sp. UC 10]KAA0990385.1 zinc-binding dehydrogenase [Dyadobacter sp. UC 10]
MKQLAIRLRTGEVLLREVPVPILKKGYVLIKTRKSIISAGTERMLVDFGKASLLSKAFRQTDKLNQAIVKIRSQGLISTVNMLSNKLDQLMPLGYCQFGEVIAVGEGVQNLQKGDRVVSNGCHAEIVCVPAHLAARVPENVPDEEAVFTILASVGLQGIRLLGPALGETVAVTGLGLIGQLTVSLLRASGCRIIGIETDEERVLEASANGLIVLNPQRASVENQILELTEGQGVDGVIITASAPSDSIVRQAAHISRKRGKIVVIGSVGMNLRRADFYEKELTLQVSCSYGPGRYDPKYEEQGIDYPLPFVRWTENRNLRAVLDLLQSGALDVRTIIQKKVALENAAAIYGNDLKSNVVTVIEYPSMPDLPVNTPVKEILFEPTEAVIGIIGAGNFTRQTLLPLLKGAAIKYISSANGLNASELAGKYRIPMAVNGYQDILEDSEVDLVMIATRHNEHAQHVIQGLQAGKHVFVEKPLVIFQGELDQVVDAWKLSGKMLIVGFNRRFSPFILKMRQLLGNSLMHVVITVNAGKLPDTAWLKYRNIGGGRIVGECCHFIDLLSYLTQSHIVAVCSNALPVAPGQDRENVSMLVRLANGSSGVINYFSNGHHFYQKERLEVHSSGRSLVLDDFKCLTGYGFNSFTKMKSGQDKGHRNQFDRVVKAVKDGGEAPVPMQEIINTTRSTFAAMNSLNESGWIYV